MDKLKITEKFSKMQESEKVPEYLERMVLWLENKNFYRISKRVNWLLDRIRDDSHEITKEGNLIDEDGNWRFIIDGDDLCIQRYDTDTWVTYLKINGDGTIEGISACDIERTLLTPSTQTVNTGTLVSGTVTDVQTWQDGNEVNVAEVAGAPGYDVEYTITAVDDFCEIVVTFYYAGASTHDCQIQIYDDANAIWKTFIDQTGTQLGHNTRFTILPDDSTDYINSSNEVKIRFYHPVNGNASHDLYVDYVAIVGRSV